TFLYLNFYAQFWRFYERTSTRAGERFYASCHRSQRPCCSATRKPANRKFSGQSDISPLGRMKKTKTKLSPVKINGQRFYCVTCPKLGKGRNRQFFKNKPEAEELLKQKLIEQQNYGIAAFALNERQRAEYLECAEKLAPFNATLRDAV